MSKNMITHKKIQTSTMRWAERASFLTWGSVARTGAAIGIYLTFVYALVFILYAIIRSSLTILAAAPFSAGLPGTLVATGISIIVPAILISTILEFISAFLGLFTGIAIMWLLTVLNPSQSPLKAILIGLVSALGFELLPLLGLKLGFGLSFPALSVGTYLFWFGFPGIIYLGATAVGSWQLNRLASVMK